MSKRKSKATSLSLGGTWGSGKNNALTSGWGGKSKRGGGGLIPRAWGGKSKRTRLLTPAVWERRRGSKRKGSTFAQSFGLKPRGRRKARAGLDMGFSRHKQKSGTLLGALGKGGGRKRKGGGLVAALLGPKGKRGKRKRIKGLAKVIARSFMAASDLTQGSSIDATDEMVMRQRQLNAGVNELMADKPTLSNHSFEAVQANAATEDRQTDVPPWLVWFYRLRDRWQRG